MKFLTALFDRLVDWYVTRWIVPAIDGNSGGPKEAHTPEVQVITYARLRPDLIQQLERSFGEPYVSPSTTDLMAGYALGTQAVLKKLRDGYATDQP